MIVVLTGSHSCGKSTLVEFFRGKEGFTCVDSVTRNSTTAKERKIDGVEDLNETQLRILFNIKEATKEIVRMNEEDPDQVYLIDRCVFDFLAYSRAFYDRGLLSPYVLQQVVEECKEIWKIYDLVCYLPIEFSIVDDGVRSLDEDLRKDVDNYIINELLWNPVRAIKLHGSVRQRVETLQDKVHLLSAKR